MEDARAQELAGLFDELCGECGFCLDPNDRERLSLRVWRRPGDSADAVFAAEGLETPYDLHLWRQVRDRIAHYFLAL